MEIKWGWGEWKGTDWIDREADGEGGSCRHGPVPSNAGSGQAHLVQARAKPIRALCPLLTDQIKKGQYAKQAGNNKVAQGCLEISNTDGRIVHRSRCLGKGPECVSQCRHLRGGPLPLYLEGILSQAYELKNAGFLFKEPRKKCQQKFSLAELHLNATWGMTKRLGRGEGQTSGDRLSFCSFSYKMK